MYAVLAISPPPSLLPTLHPKSPSPPPTPTPPPEGCLQCPVLVLLCTVRPAGPSRQPPAALVVLAALHTPVQQQAARLNVCADADDLRVRVIHGHIDLGVWGGVREGDRGTAGAESRQAACNVGLMGIGDQQRLQPRAQWVCSSWMKQPVQGQG